MSAGVIRGAFFLLCLCHFVLIGTVYNSPNGIPVFVCAGFLNVYVVLVVSDYSLHVPIINDVVENYLKPR